MALKKYNSGDLKGVSDLGGGDIPEVNDTPVNEGGFLSYLKFFLMR